MRIRAALMLGAFLAVVTSGTVFGQGFQGGLRGSIKDSGGVIPGVEVTLTNERTNIARSTVTNERGEYVFTQIDPGSYFLKAALTGYKTIERREIPIGTQQFLTMDLAMEVGAIEENITVTGQSPIIETSNASQGTVLDSQALQTLPSPGRAAFLIGASVPTVVPSGDAQFNRQQDQTNASLLSLGGGTRRGNNYTLDGVPITDLTNRAVANPTIESLEDVKVQVHTYDAEMGRTGGGVFNTTLKSGSNKFRGTAFFQTRPVWAAANNYFSQKALEACRAGDTACVNLNKKQSTKWYTPGVGFGGPIKKDRTFFWFASEDYHNISTRNSPGLVLPTSLERRGDFSQSRNGTTPVVIYDPLTRQPFPGNVIPANRINPIAAKILSYVPAAQRDVSDGASNYNAQAVLNDKFQQLYSVKLEHKFTDKVSLTGFYLYNRTDEPCSNFLAGQDDPNRFIDPGDYILKRRPQILALNNTWVLSDSSVMALRFGWTTFPDNPSLSIDFDPATLGFSQNFMGLVGQTGVPKFPIIDFTAGYDDYGHQNPVKSRVYNSWGANGTFSRFVGTHTFKIGADFRQIGALLDSTSNPSGNFIFGREFTSSTGINNGSAVDGNAMATFLLGFPSGDFQASGPSLMGLTTPLDLYTNYFGGYVQDDWRVSPKFTLNYGLRIEHEDGMRERNNNFTVGFDRTSTSPVNVTIANNVDPSGGTPARQVVGGLKFAGVNGNATQQGDPPAAKFSPRLGAVYSITSKTVLRAGYGVYWSPWNYPAPSPASYGGIGFSNATSSPQSTVTPTVSLTNPFPNGLVKPSGSNLGLLAGAGTNINFVDETRKAPRVQQYTVDLQRELANDMSITFSYVGARGDHLPLGGTVNSAVNINQLDPKYLALGSAVLAQPVPNPFQGNPAFGASALGTNATTTRGQLLRPFPQFGDISMYQVSEGVNRYDAGVVELSKRVTHGWGGRFSYTYSVLKDNQVGETNFYTNPGTTSTSGPINNYNYVASLPACDGGLSAVQKFNSMCFDPLVDYMNGVLDTPHRFVVAPIVALPFGKDHKIGKSGVGNLFAGGWTVAAVFTWQSGFPIGVTQSNSQSNLLGNRVRPNLVSGVDTTTSGNWQDRIASADHPSATWLNPAAFSAAAAGTFGNAPRLIVETRSPILTQTDLSAAKNVGLGGGKTVQLKIEVINLFNRLQPRGSNMSVTQGNAAFGRIVAQSGFMRLTQVMIRYSW
jgi:trimeric autotransporter adhesin